LENFNLKKTKEAFPSINVYNILTGTLLPEMSGEVLSRMASGEGIKKVHVNVGENGNFAYDIS
jgi:type VI secretion system protein VasG